MHRTLILATLLTTSALVGCLGTDGPEAIEEQSLPRDILPLPTFDAGRVKLDVPVPVVLVGFPDESVARLKELLKTEEVDHGAGDFNQVLPPDPDEGVEGNMFLLGESWDLPFLPTAVYDVIDLGDEITPRLAAELPGWSYGGANYETFDANALEAFLAEALPAAGHTPDPSAPSLVIVHLDALGIERHTWTYTFPHGYLKPVQAFGELEAMHIMDPSAVKPFEKSALVEARENVTGEEFEQYPGYLAAEGDDLQEIAWLVEEATHYRFLHSAIYPMPLTDCHAITLILGVRPTSLGEHAPMLKSAEELFHPEEIGRAFSNLTGGTVHVDAKVLMLPVDDPVLDTLSRGEFASLELQRAWISENWADYWVPHEGCEPYVSFLVHGDAASAASGIIGIGTYDESKSYRISISWVNEALRLAFDPASPVNVFGHESMDYNWIDFLFAHEVGHTIGMHHPFHSGKREGTFSNQYFQDAWTAMSYSTDGRVIDFGAIDQNNWQRNRLGYVLAAAEEQGLEGSEAWDAAMDHAAQRHWDVAADLLYTAMRETGMEHDHRASWLPDGLVVMPSPSMGAHPMDAALGDGHVH